jgi:hypothetical protein
VKSFGLPQPWKCISTPSLSGRANGLRVVGRALGYRKQSERRRRALPGAITPPEYGVGQRQPGDWDTPSPWHVGFAPRRDEPTAGFRAPLQLPHVLRSNGGPNRSSSRKRRRCSALMAVPPFPKPKTNRRLPPWLWVWHQAQNIGLPQPHSVQSLGLGIDDANLDLGWSEPRPE